jgi:hypothetical protein
MLLGKCVDGVFSKQERSALIIWGYAHLFGRNVSKSEDTQISVLHQAITANYGLTGSKYLNKARKGNEKKVRYE